MCMDIEYFLHYSKSHLQACVTTVSVILDVITNESTFCFFMYVFF